MLLLNRGMFIGMGNRELETGSDAWLLSKIYENVSDNNGICIMGAESVSKETSREATDTSETYCKSCCTQGHRATDCTKPLVCATCLKTGHNASFYTGQFVERCRNCRATEHSEENCPFCKNCKSPDHASRHCPKGKECHHCKVTDDHLAMHCPLKPPFCHNCRAEGHLSKDCGCCNVCYNNEHHAKKCPATTTCKKCGLKGHYKTDCPSNICKFCNLTGHKEADCPQRRVEGSKDLICAAVGNLFEAKAFLATEGGEGEGPTALSFNNLVQDMNRPKGLKKIRDWNPPVYDPPECDVAGGDTAGGEGSGDGESGWGGTAGGGTAGGDTADIEGSGNGESGWGGTAGGEGSGDGESGWGVTAGGGTAGIEGSGNGDPAGVVLLVAVRLVVMGDGSGDVDAPW